MVSETLAARNGDSSAMPRNSKPYSERIFWDDAEFDKVAEIAARLHLKEPEELLVRHVNRAQQQLPANRRRKIDSLSGKGHERLVRLVRQKIQEAVAPPVLPLPAPTPPPPPPPPPPVLNPEGLLGEPSLAGLAFAFLSRLEEMHEESLNLQRAVYDVLARLSTPAGEKAPPPPARGKLPRVAVYGLLADQANRLKALFRGRVELIAFNKTAPDNPPNAELHLIAVQFVGHSVQERLYGSGIEREKVVLVKGTGDSFVILIDRLLEKLKEKKSP